MSFNRRREANRVKNIAMQRFDSETYLDCTFRDGRLETHYYFFGPASIPTDIYLWVERRTVYLYHVEQANKEALKK